MRCVAVCGDVYVSELRKIEANVTNGYQPQPGEWQDMHDISNAWYKL